MTRQPVWIREGYRFTYYPYAGHTDFQHPAGTLGPIEKLDIKDVVVDRAPDSGSDKQVMAIFEKDGKRFAFPIGVVANGDYKIYSDDILFIQDPHELYKHWPAEVWKLIDAHQMQPGMNELQASFAIGMGAPEGSGMSNPRIVDYPKQRPSAAGDLHQWESDASSARLVAIAPCKPGRLCVESERKFVRRRKSMKAIRVHEFGGPEVMKLEDVPDLQPGPGQVVVRIHAAGVNPVKATSAPGPTR